VGIFVIREDLAVVRLFTVTVRASLAAFVFIHSACIGRGAAAVRAFAMLKDLSNSNLGIWRKVDGGRGGVQDGQASAKAISTVGAQLAKRPDVLTLGSSGQSQIST
jgi:hypothetical protein